MATLRAFTSKDRERYLGSLGVYKKVASGEARCAMCVAQITLDSLTAVYPKGEQVMFVCENMLCYDKLLREKNDG